MIIDRCWICGELRSLPIHRSCDEIQAIRDAYEEVRTRRTRTVTLSPQYEAFLLLCVKSKAEWSGR